MTLYDFTILSLKVLRKLNIKLGLIKRSPDFVDFRYVEYFGQAANDLLYETLKKGDPCMVSKFGTMELQAIISSMISFKNLSKDVIGNFMAQKITLYRPSSFQALKTNAGFFPNDAENVKKFVELMLGVIPNIDILSSYLYAEKYIERFLSANCKRIDLEGLYAPWLFKNPWTRILKGKKVLVVTPFEESITRQYENNRDKLFKDPEVLPEFQSLQIVRAVQSIGGYNEDFENWFEALEHMHKEIKKYDFDIAIIGCGAYGMPLASLVKDMGKQAVHMGGWVQMLFGVYGKRWTDDQPQYKDVINEYWIRPQEKEKPIGAEKVEGGCYW